MRKSLLVALAVVLLGQADQTGAQIHSLPRPTVTLSGNAASSPLRFENYRRWMVVEARVAGSDPLRFILDSGAPVVVLASRELGERLPLQIIGQARVGGAGDGDAATVALASEVTVELDGVTIENASMAVGAAGEAIPGMDGILGGSLFRNLVVEIDWGSSMLTLHEPARFEYNGNGVVLPLTLLSSGHLLVEGTVAQGSTARTARLLVDTGAGHALSLEPTLITPAAPLSDLIIGWGSNGVARGDIGVVESLRLGSVELRDVITAFPASGPWTGIGAAQGEVIHGNIGQRILRRFHVIFDVPGGRLILDPGPTFGDPFAFDTTGLAIAPWSPRSDELEIAEVIPGSPAAEAGIRAGDVLLAIDGRRVAEINPAEVETMLWGPPGGQVEVAVRQNGERRQHRLTRRALLRER